MQQSTGLTATQGRSTGTARGCRKPHNRPAQRVLKLTRELMRALCTDILMQKTMTAQGLKVHLSLMGVTFVTLAAAKPP